MQVYVNFFYFSVRQNSVSPIEIEVERQCSICLDELDITEMNVTLIAKCGHMFHLNCLMTWLMKQRTCPVCRFEVPSVHRHIQILLPDDPTVELDKISERSSKSCSTSNSSHIALCPV